MSQDLRREGRFGVPVSAANATPGRRRRHPDPRSALLLQELLPEHVPPAAVEEAVQDIRRDDFGQGEAGGLQSPFQDQRLGRQHGAHHEEGRKDGRPARKSLEGRRQPHYLLERGERELEGGEGPPADSQLRAKSESLGRNSGTAIYMGLG